MMKRRQLLKRSALLGGAPLILPSRLLADKANRKLNVGFIGMGRRSTSLLPQFMKEKEVKVVAVCDLSLIHI